MREDAKAMSCEDFQNQLAEWVGSSERPAPHPHLQHCARCRALLADLEKIAEAARELSPVTDPPDRLWEQIESAIRRESSSATAD